MSQKRKRSVESEAEQDKDVEYFCSEYIEDRQSRFVGIYSPTLPVKDLQSLAEIASASHKIAAWRRESNQQSLTSAKRYVSGSDDDGEKYAGRKVEQALKDADVTGSCVVARWWGGIMLGPARFDHIETSAREAIRRWRESVAELAAKKQRTELDEAERQKLLKALVARDRSIGVLRELAAQKEAELSNSSASKEKEADQSASSSRPAIAVAQASYEIMPLERLKALDKARDATVAFLLKRIDKAEASMKAKDESSTRERDALD